MTTVSTVFLGVVLFLVGSVVVFMTVIEPRRSVAEVRMTEGRVQKISIKAFQQRLRFERVREVYPRQIANAKARWQDRVIINERPLYTLGFAAGVLERMTREILIREAAAQRGLTASAEEVDQLIEKTNQVLFRNPAPATVPAAPGSVPATGATPAASPPTVVASPPRQAPAVLDLPREDLPANYRDIFRTEILEKKLQTAFLESIPRQQDRMQLKLIRFEFEADAQKAAESLSPDATFAGLYARVTAGSVGSATVAAREWTSAEELKHDFNPALSQAAFRLAVGEPFSRPISAAKGWYLAQVEGREMRTMSDEWRHQRGIDAFDHWLEQQRSRVTQFPIWMKRVPLKWLPLDLPDSHPLPGPSSSHGPDSQNPFKSGSGKSHPGNQPLNHRSRPDLGWSQPPQIPSHSPQKGYALPEPGR